MNPNKLQRVPGAADERRIHSMFVGTDREYVHRFAHAAPWRGVEILPTPAEKGRDRWAGSGEGTWCFELEPDCEFRHSAAMDLDSSPPGQRDFIPAVQALIFIGIVLVIGLGIGYLTRPGEWYDSLEKPFFQPPAWLFAPVWTILYVLIAIAGWRIWRRNPQGGAMRLWFVQMLLNWLWSPIFFGAQAPWPAFAIIVALLAVILAFIAHARRVDRPAAWLFVPYAAWVSFATVLNGSIAVLNSA